MNVSDIKSVERGAGKIFITFKNSTPVEVSEEIADLCEMVLRDRRDLKIVEKGLQKLLEKNDIMLIDFPIMTGGSICRGCLDKRVCILSKSNRYEREEHPTLGAGEELLMVDPPKINIRGEVEWCPVFISRLS